MEDFITYMLYMVGFILGMVYQWYKLKPLLKRKDRAAEIAIEELRLMKKNMKNAVKDAYLVNEIEYINATMSEGFDKRSALAKAEMRADDYWNRNKRKFLQR